MKISAVHHFIQSKKLGRYHQVFFVAFVYLFLGFWYRDLLWYSDQNSLFLFHSSFLGEHLHQPGGILLYISRFFTQFCYYPGLGAIPLTFFLWLLAYLVRTLCAIPPGSIFLSFIPSLLLILTFIQQGLMVFWMRSAPASLFTYTLGMVFSIGFLWGAQRMRKLWLRIAYWGVLFPVLYIITGGYALFALCLAVSGLAWKPTRTSAYLILSAIVYAAAGLVFCYYIAYDNIPLRQIFLSGFFDTPMIREEWIYATQFALFASVPILWWWGHKIRSARAKPAGNSLVPVFGLPVLIAGCCLLSASDPNFRPYLHMDRAVQYEDWKVVLQTGTRCKTPYPEMFMYWNLALCKTNQLGELMFHYPQYLYGSAGLYYSPTDRPLVYPCIKEIYEQLGAIYVAHWVTTEELVNRGTTNRLLTKLARQAAIAGEKTLSNKYLYSLRATLFYKRHAQRISQLLPLPVNLIPDKAWTEKSAMLEQSKNILMGTHHLFQFLQQDMDATLNNRYLFEEYLALLLLDRELDPFFQMIAYIRRFGVTELPTHYQEALLIYQITKGTPIPLPFSISAKVQKSFERFIALNQQHNIKAIEVEFKNSYFYYYSIQ